MGLLDDAIREHLELKRKHGADPDNVARQEQEALGQGGPRAEFAQTAEPEGGPSAEFAQTEEPEGVAEAEAAAKAETRADAEDALADGDPGIPEEPSEGHAGEAPGYDEDPWLDEDADEVPAEESLEPRTQQRPAGDEDVLEETPDFLQETPEHDRLWFEQKPPRDFDWDK
jgi:hypothetical protein